MMDLSSIPSAQLVAPSSLWDAGLGAMWPYNWHAKTWALWQPVEDLQAHFITTMEPNQ